MISALIVISGIIIVFVAGKENIEAGVVTVCICAMIAAILGTAEIPALINFIYSIYFAK